MGFSRQASLIFGTVVVLSLDATHAPGICLRKVGIAAGADRVLRKRQLGFMRGEAV
jgi:hypothetical protein